MSIGSRTVIATRVCRHRAHDGTPVKCESNSTSGAARAVGIDGHAPQAMCEVTNVALQPWSF